MSAVPLRNNKAAGSAVRSVTVLGATGSIGDSTMDLLRAARARYRVEALTANSNVDALAKLATSPWVAPWPVAGQPDTYLLDLACARECAQADAVSFGPRDYEFTLGATEPALARRELFLPGGPPAAAWGARGLRLFSIGAH